MQKLIEEIPKNAEKLYRGVNGREKTKETANNKLIKRLPICQFFVVVYRLCRRLSFTNVNVCFIISM